MSAIEDLLTGAFEADAQMVRAEDVPPLMLPGQRRAYHRWSPRTIRLIIPLAAAVAVIAAVLATEVVVPLITGGPDAHGRALSQRARIALFGAAAGIRQPRFLVGLASGNGSTSDIGVYGARTGRMIAHVNPPRPGLTFTATAATAGGLSFVVAAAPRSGPCETGFYRLLLSPAGQLASLTPLALVDGEIIPPSGLAASADGRTIAFTANRCGAGKGWLGVMDLASRKVRKWRADAEDLWSLSLSENGRLVLYVNSTVYGGDGSVQVLRTDARPGTLSQRARVVIPGDTGVAADGSVALTPDGKTVLACTESGPGTSGHRTAVLSALTVATGMPLGVVQSWRNPAAAPCVISAAPASGYLFLSDISRRGIGTAIDVATGQSWQVGARAAEPPDWTVLVTMEQFSRSCAPSRAGRAAARTGCRAAAPAAAS